MKEIYVISVMGRPKTKKAPPFGQRLARFRQARGFTQEEFAEMLGISRKMVDHYECRTKNPTAEFLVKATKALNVSADELLGLKISSVKPGPIPKIERQVEDLRKLPPGKQKLISDMIETVMEASLASS